LPFIANNRVHWSVDFAFVHFRPSITPHSTWYR